MFVVKLMGHVIGNAESFDVIDNDNTESHGIQYQGFVPEMGILPDTVKGVVFIDYIEGEITVYGEDGSTVAQKLIHCGQMQFT